MQAAPAFTTGARLTRAAAETLIARRLQALGHPLDLLDDGAINALIEDAAGSGRRLRSSLAAALFLASTEDAPLVDAWLVRRALTPPASQPSPRLRVDVPRRRWFTASGFYLIAGLSALAVSMAWFILRPPAPTEVTTGLAPGPAMMVKPAVQSVTPPAAVLQKLAKPAQSPAPSPPVVAADPSPTRTLPPLPPAIAVRSLPVPATSQPPASPISPAVLPVSAPAAILLLYSTRDPAALDRLSPIALRLQHAGMTDIRAKPVHAPSPRRSISYFYSEDEKLAELIAKTLAGSDWPNLQGNSLRPLLVLPPPGLPAHNPGTIVIQLP